MQWPSQSPDLIPIEHAFHLLKTKCPKNKQELKTVAVEAWQSITRDGTQHLVMSMRSRLQAVIEMVNGLHLYSAFIQSAFYNFFASHSPIHTHIHTPTAIGCHARYQPARQEQLGVRCLAQGHFDTPRVGSNRQPSDCQTTALPPEPYRPQIDCKGFATKD